MTVKHPWFRSTLVGIGRLTLLLAAFFAVTVIDLPRALYETIGYVAVGVLALRTILAHAPHLANALGRALNPPDPTMLNLLVRMILIGTGGLVIVNLAGGSERMTVVTGLIVVALALAAVVAFVRTRRRDRMIIGQVRASVTSNPAADVLEGAKRSRRHRWRSTLDDPFSGKFDTIVVISDGHPLLPTGDNDRALEIDCAKCEHADLNALVEAVSRQRVTQVLWHGGPSRQSARRAVEAALTGSTSRSSLARLLGVPGRTLSVGRQLVLIDGLHHIKTVERLMRLDGRHWAESRSNVGVVVVGPPTWSDRVDLIQKCGTFPNHVVSLLAAATSGTNDHHVVETTTSVRRITTPTADGSAATGAQLENPPDIGDDQVRLVAVGEAARLTVAWTLLGRGGIVAEMTGTLEVDPGGTTADPLSDTDRILLLLAGARSQLKILGVESSCEANRILAARRLVRHRSRRSSDGDDSNVEHSFRQMVERVDRLVDEHKETILSLGHALTVEPMMGSGDVAAVIERRLGPFVDGRLYGTDLFDLDSWRTGRSAAMDPPWPNMPRIERKLAALDTPATTTDDGQPGTGRDGLRSDR